MSVEQLLAILTVMSTIGVMITGFLTWKTTQRRQVSDQMGILVTALQTENKRCEERLERLEERDEEKGRQIAAQAAQIDSLTDRNYDLDFQVRTLREALRAYRHDTPPGGTPRLTQ